MLNNQKKNDKRKKKKENIIQFILFNKVFFVSYHIFIYKNNIKSQKKEKRKKKLKNLTKITSVIIVINYHPEIEYFLKMAHDEDDYESHRFSSCYE